MMVVFKMRDSVPIARDITTFVMYCVYGESGSSLLMDSTDSMMIIINLFVILFFRNVQKLGILTCLYF